MNTSTTALDRRGAASAVRALVVASIFVISICLAACAGTHAVPPASPLLPAPVTTQANGTTFTDVDGNAIHAHGGGVLEHKGTYYWVGEDRGEDDRFRFVSLYASADLVHWRFVAHILSQETHPELASATVERPKLLYNHTTDRFVLWMHWENGSDYSEARVAVATSATVDGQYQYSGSFRPLGFESRDMTVFADDDGHAYLVSASAGNADLHIYRLDESYTGIQSLIARPAQGAYREAPAVFAAGDRYYLLTSGATGWNPNQAMYATASDLAGPWSEWRAVGDATAFGSQASFVLPVRGTQGTDYIYLGDRWGGVQGLKVNDSSNVWLEIAVDPSGGLTMDWADKLAIDVVRGTVEPASPPAALGPIGAP